MLTPFMRNQPPMKRAVYNKGLQRLTYYTSDRLQSTLEGITESQAKVELRSMALSIREIVQTLDIVTDPKL